MATQKKPQTKTANTTRTSASKPAVKKNAATKALTKTATKTATKTTNKTPTKRATKQTAVPAAPRSTAKPATAKGQNKSLTLRGRSVFLVQTTSAGVTVRTAWMSEDKTLRDMPAVFPDVNYAINLIDDLKQQVLKHFSQAAQVGAQAIARQRDNNKATPSDQ